MNITEIKVGPNAMIFQNSAPYNGVVIIIEEGSAEVVKEGVYIGTSGPGEFIGEMAAISGEKRSAMVRAGHKGMKGIRLEEESAGELTEFLTEACHTSTAKLLAQMAQRLRETTQELVDTKRALAEAEKNMIPEYLPKEEEEEPLSEL